MQTRRNHPPIQIHPKNEKYFLFRGKPAFLLTATEHYGSVLNRPFDFHKYLDDLVDKRMTCTRTFCLFREIASEKNPASTCKPKPEDYIAPWPRTGTKEALDGQPQFDLSKWNDEFFQRLHSFLDLALQRGIIVELTLLSNSYAPEVWALNPLRAENNVQGIGRIEWPQYTSLKNGDVLAYQLAHVRKIVQETASYENVYYEICNEPGGGVAGHVTPGEVDAWQMEIAKTIREQMKRAGSEHLIFGSEAFSYTPVFTQGLDKTFDGDLVDVVNVHPLPNTVLGGKAYQLGNFMSKELQLRELNAFALASWSRKKPSVWDEDNCATMFRDEVGWTIHRKRAWTALLSGAHYDMIDFSIQNGLEAGTAESQTKLRMWFRHLSEFFGSIDFINAAPGEAWVSELPQNVLATTFVVAGKDYVAYLADAREVRDASAGEAILPKVAVKLPAGKFWLRFFSPVDGEYSEGMDLWGGRPQILEFRKFRHDLVIHAVRID
ncbi:MAG TPA: cellulase family glycosylhydrolase [Tepidisphaeraceae bacterium]|nr:cellulase family glycosylhydrolase [Tepidisphaeraceae bacterium]